MINIKNINTLKPTPDTVDYVRLSGLAGCGAVGCQFHMPKRPIWTSSTKSYTRVREVHAGRRFGIPKRFWVLHDACRFHMPKRLIWTSSTKSYTRVREVHAGRLIVTISTISSAAARNAVCIRQTNRLQPFGQFHTSGFEKHKPDVRFNPLQEFLHPPHGGVLHPCGYSISTCRRGDTAPPTP